MVLFFLTDCDNCGKLDDEFHLLFECNMYINLRKQFIDVQFTNNPSMLKTVQLLNSEDVRTINRLGIFLKKAFKLLYERDCIQGAPGPTVDE